MPTTRFVLLCVLLLAATICGCKNREPKSLVPVDSFEHWGFIDHSGKVKIPLVFEHAQSFSEGLAAVQYHGKCGYIDATGRFVLRPVYESASPFRNGIAEVSTKANGDLNSTTWFIDRTGRLVHRPNWWDWQWFGESMPRLFPTPDNLTASKIAAWKEIYDPRKARDLPMISLRRTEPDDRYGYADSSGRFVIQPSYTEAQPFYEGLAWVRLDTQRLWACIDTTGELVQPPIYDYAGAFSQNRARVTIGGVPTLIDREGHRVCSGLGLMSYFENGLAPCKVGSKVGFVDTMGTFRFASIRDEANGFKDGVARVCSDGKSGFVNSQGILVVPLVFDDCWPWCSEGVALGNIKTGRTLKWGFMDTTGHWIAPPSYDRAEIFHDGLAAVATLRK